MDISCESNASDHHMPPCINDFDIIKPISRGAFGQVFLGTRQDHPGQMYAIKVMKKKDVINKNMIEQVDKHQKNAMWHYKKCDFYVEELVQPRESNILSQVVAERDALAISKNSHIVNLFYSFQSMDKIFLVMEYLVGGDVKSLLHNLGYFDEDMARIYTAQVILALSYLHSHGIIHRDLKPDNMLVSNEGKIKLTDFGLSSLNRNCKPSFIDVMSTPSVDAPYSRGATYFRTPGQILSLTTDFTFSIPRSAKPGPGQRTRVNSTSSSMVSQRTEYMKSYIFSPPEPRQTRAKSFSTSLVIPSPLSEGYQHTREMTPLTGGPVVKRTQFASKVSQRMFHPVSSDSDDDSPCNKNMHLLSPDDENQLPDCKKRRVSSTGLTRVLEGMDFRQRSGSFMDSFDSHASNIPITNITGNLDSVSEEMGRTVGELHDLSNMVFSAEKSHTPMLIRTENFEGVSELIKNENFQDLDHELSSSLISSDKSRLSISPLSSTRLPTTPASQTIPLTSGYGSSINSSEASDMKLSENNFKSKRRHSFLGKENNPLNYLELKEASLLETTKDQASIEQNVPCASPLPMELVNASIKHTPKPMEMSYHQTHRTPGMAMKTPYRTPKSCRRIPVAPRNRILGTPDYLAPEILMGLAHTAAVDWWAVGVCLYEFLTGVPPFNDETPELVFNHIKNRELLWPEGEEALTTSAVDCIDKILTIPYEMRPGAEDIKSLSFFECLNWENLDQHPAPFIPNPDDACDTTYFDAKNNIQNLKLSSFYQQDL